MDCKISDELVAQANHELFAAYSYKAISLWCVANDYSGFASFFDKQFAEELQHADKFLEHLLARGECPELSGLSKPRSEFDGLIEVAKHALSLEKLNSQKIRKCYEVSLEAKDYESQRLLLWFIDEQVEEEAWASRLVTLAQRSECPGAALNLDRHLNTILASE